LTAYKLNYKKEAMLHYRESLKRIDAREQQLARQQRQEADREAERTERQDRLRAFWRTLHADLRDDEGPDVLRDSLADLTDLFEDLVGDPGRKRDGRPGSEAATPTVMTLIELFYRNREKWRALRRAAREREDELDAKNREKYGGPDEPVAADRDQVSAVVGHDHDDPVNSQGEDEAEVEDMQMSDSEQEELSGSALESSGKAADEQALGLPLEYLQRQEELRSILPIRRTRSSLAPSEGDLTGRSVDDVLRETTRLRLSILGERIPVLPEAVFGHPIHWALLEGPDPKAFPVPVTESFFDHPRLLPAWLGKKMKEALGGGGSGGGGGAGRDVPEDEVRVVIGVLRRKQDQGAVLEGLKAVLGAYGGGEEAARMVLLKLWRYLILESENRYHP
jgi:hypothetical protein